MDTYNWDEHRQIVADSRAALERTSASIARSNQIAIETEQIGTEVLGDLGEQRETLLRGNRRLHNVNEDLSRSHAALRAIRRHVFYNKFILILIIILEVGVLSGLIYIKVARK